MTMSAQSDYAPLRLGAGGLAAALAAITLARLAVLMITPLNLHGDEAQYWSWSRSFDFGYFSKPPLIAWVIGATTALFGDQEWGVRFAAPLAHAGAAGALYWLGRRMYGHAAGVWAALGWMLMPGVWLSAALISTDALLLPLWAAALLCGWRLIETRSWAWAAALGVACGLGLLAKYAMLYFLAGAALAIIVSKPARAAFLSAQGALALGVSALLASPNLAWNATHRFATVSHTLANADLEHAQFNVAGLFSFLRDQFAVFGPIAFAALLVLMVLVARRRAADERDRYLLAFAVPPLAIIAAEAVLSRAHANWAAAAYPSAVVWLAGRLAQGPGRLVLAASAVLHALCGLAFLVLGANPSLADQVWLSNSMKRARGWPETARAIAAVAAAGTPEGRYSAIMVDDRLTFFCLSYYWRDATIPAPLRIWRPGAATNQAQAVAPLTPGAGRRVLAVLTHHDSKPIAESFARFRPLAHRDIALGGASKRSLDFAIGEGYAPAKIATTAMESSEDE
jgi:4-amino-4-deoxy-L-arabinose transferase-like glycosyltransferase